LSKLEVRENVGVERRRDLCTTKRERIDHVEVCTYTFRLATLLLSYPLPPQRRSSEKRRVGRGGRTIEGDDVKRPMRSQSLISLRPEPRLDTRTDPTIGGWRSVDASLKLRGSQGADGRSGVTDH
jgi:hypothetical protein